jgi:hypothetical protein
VDGIGVIVSDRADRKRHNNFLVSLRQLCHLAGDFRRIAERIRVAPPRQSRNSTFCPICNWASAIESRGHIGKFARAANGLHGNAQNFGSRGAHPKTS